MRVIKIMLLVAAYFCSVAHAEPTGPEMTAGIVSELSDEFSISNACSELTQFEDTGCSAPNISLSELSKLLAAPGLSGMNGGIVPPPPWIPYIPFKPERYGNGPCAPLARDFCERLKTLPIENLTCEALVFPGHVVPFFCYGNEPKVCCFHEPLLGDTICAPHKAWGGSGGEGNETPSPLYRHICTTYYGKSEECCRTFFKPPMDFCSDYPLGSRCESNGQEKNCLKEDSRPPRDYGYVRRLLCKCSPFPGIGCRWTVKTP